MGDVAAGDRLVAQGGASRWRAACLAALVLLAAAWLGYESYRFFVRPERIGPVEIHLGAIDFLIFRSMVGDWWRGIPVYSGPAADVHTYPPASMLVFAPVYGWPDERVATAVYVVTFAIALAWWVATLVRESGANRHDDRWLAACALVAAYPIGAVLGNGQVSLHAAVPLLAALLVLRDRPVSWRRDGAVAVLLVLALAKPSLAAPFVLVALVLPGGLRAVALAAALYAAITLVASSVQPGSLVEQLGQFVARAWSQSMRGGESNLHSLLAHAGLANFMPHASLAAFAALAVFMMACRRADPWLLIGVAAVAARFWTYHRWYDDLLIPITVVALARIGLSEAAPSRAQRPAMALAIATIVFLLAPGGLYALPSPWNDVYRVVQVVLWVAGASLLGALAWEETRGRRWAAWRTAG